MSTIITIQATDIVANSRADLNANFAALNADKQETSAKDATGGYVGLTLFKINFKNVANTFTSFLTNANTAARTYTFPDASGTVALTSDIPSVPVSSVFARTGAVIAANGDYNTSQVTEVTNLYFTTARVLATLIAGYTSGAGTVAASDTILQAIQKLNGNDALRETSSNKDATGGYVGMTLFKINFKNAANTFTNFFTNATTAARTYTFPDKDITVAGLADVLTTLLAGYTSGSGTVSASDNILQAIQKLNGNDALRETSSNKDATGGYAGLTLFKINFKNAANTFTSFFTNANTAARTYTFPDKDLTVAGIVDIPSSTSTLTEGSNLYFTTARVLATAITGYVSGSGTVSATDTILQAINKLNGNDGLRELSANKDATGGYVGMTLFKINFKNAANTFTNFFTNATTAARTYTFQDRNGTIADDTDLALKAPLASPSFTGTVTLPTGLTGILKAASGVVSAVTAPSGTIVGTSDTQTLTNKRVSPRTGTTTSSATPTINTDNVDFYSITAQSGNITSMSTNLSGTPTEAQTLWLAMTATSGTPTITWGANFEASAAVALPAGLTTTRLDVGFVWNTVTSKWRCVASA